MNWEEKKKEKEQAYFEERKRFLGMSDVEAANLSMPDQYQRMRFQREVEAAEWLKELRKGIIMPTALVEKPIARHYQKPTKIIYNQD